MTMTDTKPDAPTKPTAPKGMEPIRVRALRFPHSGGGGGGIDLGRPFRAHAPMIQAGTKSTNEETQIQYEPWTRMYRVRFVVNGKLEGERCIPESWAAYEPEPAA